MISRKAYRRVVQSLKTMKEAWLQDRIENPQTVPYEIDNSLKMAIERTIREEDGSTSRSIMAQKVHDCIEYLVSTNQIIRSPYGGHMFSLPPGHANLPTKEEFVRNVQKKLDDQKFFGG